MLGKLLKLDIMFGWKKFAAMAVAVVIAGFALPYIMSAVAFAVTPLFATLLLIIGVLCVYVCCQYFNRNLFGSEGYLMFTLPVKSGCIVASKLIVTVIWMNVMFCAAGVAALLIERFAIKEVVDILFNESKWKLAIQLLLRMNVIGMLFISASYFSEAWYMNSYVKNRPLRYAVGLIITLAFIFISMAAVDKGVEMYVESAYFSSILTEKPGGGFMALWMPIIIGFAISMLFTAIYGILTNLIIKKRLNLK